MSNNNHPHGHLSQAAQNPSWNPLQIPSYIPRQPQLAHMSNERSMVRSPLAWHAPSGQPPPPPTPDALYNFMSANHKNVTTCSSFCSSLVMPTSQKKTQRMHQTPANFYLHNLTTNAPTTAAVPGHLQSMSATAAAAAASKYLNANGASGAADCESLLPPPPSTPPKNNNTNSNHSNSSGSGNTSNSNNNVPSPHYMQSRDENFKLTQLKNLQNSPDMNSKDCGYTGGAQTGKHAAHNLQQQQQQHAKKPSPLRNYSQQQQPPPYNMTPAAANMKYNGPQTPPTPQSPLDYNQLHLHHHHPLHAGYAPPTQQQHMQEQQHMLYAGATHSHLLAPPAPHINSSPYQQQQQQQQQSQLQQQQQQAAAPQQTHTPQMHSRNAPLTNLDMLPKQQHEEEPQTIITDLSTTTAYRNNAAPAPTPTPPAATAAAAAAADDKQLPEAPESPYMTTSNEESLESNSNSSNSRKRRKRKSSQVMRVTPSEPIKKQRTPSPQSNSCSPKHSPKNGNDTVDFQHFGLKPQENGCSVTPPAISADNSNSSSALFNDASNPKTKKQRQALLQRNLTEQQQQHQQIREQHDEEEPLPLTNASASSATQMPPPPSPPSNSSSSSSSSSSAATRSSHSMPESSEATQIKQLPLQPDNNNKVTVADTPASPALMEQGNIDAKPAVSVHEEEEDQEATAINQTPPQTATATTPPTTTTAAAAPAVAAATKPLSATEDCQFNEVEDKLEQMFAGIEDEPAEQETNETKTAAEATHDLSAQLALDSVAKLEPKSASSTPPAASTPTPEVRPMATKASMKSTMPSPIRIATPTPPPIAEAPTEISKAAVAPPPQPPPASAKLTARTPPTRCMPPRRLSMGMDPSLLRFTFQEQQPAAKAKKNAGRKKQPAPALALDSEDDDKPSTSAAAAAALARKLSEAAAAAKASNAKANNTSKSKKKQAAPKGKKAAAPKQNNKKATNNLRKPPSTDEDSTPAPTGNGGAAAELRFKSPFVLIKPDGSLSIKNTHNAEDLNEKHTKKKHTKTPHERKNLRGMHSSTLSNRYDADTTDSSWICVFCKRGPHKLGLGDLFGPYLISIDCEEYRAALQLPATGAQDIDSLFVSKRKRADMVKLQRNLPVVPATLAHIMQAPKISMHKRKRKQTHDSQHSFSDDQHESQSQCSSQDPLDCSHEAKFAETFRGMSKTSELGYEIWMHEDCAIWANDIQLIGAHVNGLDAAVWDSTRYQCVRCAQPGANICCFQRACKAAAHVPCARDANWRLSEKNRQVYCELHQHETSAIPTAIPAMPLPAPPQVQSTVPTAQPAPLPPPLQVHLLP
ncbi:CG5098 [Drosophila busckii]|uniref:CG5098 n=1 Tax=Drosophila busckii TaxID=30019 RepID=A0A0M3QVB9_DROBS|nr:CG5098 [Drosophila busckii]